MEEVAMVENLAFCAVCVFLLIAVGSMLYEVMKRP